MSARPIRKARSPLDGSIRAAPSKSVTHRALVAAALASGPSTIQDPLDADDTRCTRDGLRGLGVGVEDAAEGGGWCVEGCGGAIAGGASLDLRESGTSLRFLLAVAALGRSPSRLDGAPRLRERPVGELAEALSSLGGRVALDPIGGGLPLEVGGAALRGGSARIRAGRSSQFASALLLIGSRLPAGVDLRLEPPVVSAPYLELSAQVLRRFGVEARRLAADHWRVDPVDYRGRVLRVDGDHSSASYFLAAAAVAGGRIRVNGLASDSTQPDARLGGILETMGCRVRRGADWIEVAGTGHIPPFDLDVTEAPDLAPTLAVLALFAEGRSRLGGAAHLRLKESDRLAVLARNLEALGRSVRAGPDFLEVEPRRAPLRGARIHTASDHRIAMALAVAGLRIDGVEIDDPDCVRKSNPAFWTDFATLES